MEKEVYKTIDDFLLKLKNDNTGTGINFDRGSSIGRNAIAIMKEHALIHFRSVNEVSSLVDISILGERVISSSGIEAYLTELADRKNSKAKKELQKLDIDIKNASRVFKTYWWTFGFSILALLLSLWNFFRLLI